MIVRLFTNCSKQRAICWDSVVFFCSFESILMEAIAWVLLAVYRTCYLISLILNTLLACTVIIMISLFDPNGNLAHYVGRLWSLFNVFISGTHMEIHGKNKIEKGRAYIVMSNHQSLFDVWALIGMLPLQIRWIVKSEIRKVPVFGYTLDRMGHVYIDRQRRQDAYLSLKTAAWKIKKGTSLVIFPEGTRSEDGRLLKFRYGGAIIALKSGVPILPVTINGGRFVLPKHTLSLRPGRIQIIIGDTIDPRRFAKNSKNELMATVKAAIAKNIDLEYGRIH